MPQFAIIVTSKNDPRLSQCLASIHALRRPELAQLVVVLDGSTPRYAESIRHQVTEGPMESVLVWKSPGGTISQARNCGGTLSSAPYLVFIDSDCCPREDYLEQLAARQSPTGVVTGRVVFVSNGSWFSSGNCELRQSGYDGIYATYAYMPNLILERQVFESLGGFTPHLACGEDFELSDRVLRQGYLIAHDAQLVVRHLDDEHYTKTMKNWFRNGVGGAYRYYRARDMQRTVRLRDWLYRDHVPNTATLLGRAVGMLSLLFLNAGLLWGLLVCRRERTTPLAARRRTEAARLDIWLFPPRDSYSSSTVRATW